MFDTYKKKTRSFELRKMKAMDNFNRVKSSLPEHLKGYIVDQSQQHYTAEDQAVWRYTLRQLKDFLSTNAHSSYSDGLKKTGITVNEIPLIEDMCEKLLEFGWAALPVSGFIPPAAFMELQSLGILPIASAMRTKEHILYTPAPDIVHEAAGHAPMLVNSEFAKYLRSYAKVAKKTILSQCDLNQYDAIRELSDLKENPDSTPEQIKQAEAKLNQINSKMTFVSEAAMLGRMNWWTAEYGLIGDPNSPKIYGAGLLSSIGESKSCLSDKVKKIPLTADCLNYSYDITEQQPQLFVTQSFAELESVLSDMADTLAFRKGGTYGLEKAIQAETVNTVELDTGLQISGKLSELKTDSEGSVVYYKFDGGTQLCFDSAQLENHGKERHPHGFSSPLGKVKGLSQPISWVTEQDLASFGIVEGQNCKISYESGVVVEGQLIKKLSQNGRWILFTFENCTVTLNDVLLFDPSWGEFDLALGESVPTVFGGPADRIAFGEIQSFSKKVVPQRNHSQKEKDLFAIYESIRKMRKNEKIELGLIQEISKDLHENFPEEWLPRLEIIELLY